MELQDYGWGDMYYGMLAHASGGEYIWVDAGGLPKESKEDRGVGIILTNEMVGSIVNESLVRYYALRTLAPGGANVETRAKIPSRMSKSLRQQSLTTSLTTSIGNGNGTGVGVDSGSNTGSVGANNVGATFHGIDYRFNTGESNPPLSGTTSPTSFIFTKSPRFLPFNLTLHSTNLTHPLTVISMHDVMIFIYIIYYQALAVYPISCIESATIQVASLVLYIYYPMSIYYPVPLYYRVSIYIVLSVYAALPVHINQFLYTTLHCYTNSNILICCSLSGWTIVVISCGCCCCCCCC